MNTPSCLPLPVSKLLENVALHSSEASELAAYAKRTSGYTLYSATKTIDHLTAAISAMHAIRNRLRGVPVTAPKHNEHD